MIALLSLFSMALISSVLAQSSEEKVIATNVEAFRNAMISADKTMLGNLTAKELTYGHTTAVIENKATFIEVIVSGSTDYKTIDLSDQTIAIVDNIAIVRHTFIAEVVNKGNLQHPKLGVMQIWKKEHDKWVLLARQSFTL
jgi:hypothetical protein